MPEVEYKLIHLKRDCQAEFWPAQTHRLIAEEKHSEVFRYQDLMIGTCPKCRVDVMAWIGIDFLFEPVKKVGINESKHQIWIDRFDTDLVRPHDKHASNTVTGTVKDKNSGMYLFRNNIPVV